MDTELIKSFTLLFVLLNPFLMSIYLLDLILTLSLKTFVQVLIRASIISGAVFILFAWGGEKIFTDVLQVRFSSFLIFGGIIFSIIALRFVFLGSNAISQMRGPAEHIAGSVAMPFMIGPGTLSASVLSGARLPLAQASLAIAAALIVTVLSLAILKLVHDYVKQHNVKIIDRYVDIVGRIGALLIGTISVEMILLGFEGWAKTHNIL